MELLLDIEPGFQNAHCIHITAELLLMNTALFDFLARILGALYYFSFGSMCLLKALFLAAVTSSLNALSCHNKKIKSNLANDLISFLQIECINVSFEKLIHYYISYLVYLLECIRVKTNNMKHIFNNFCNAYPFQQLTYHIIKKLLYSSCH